MKKNTLLSLFGTFILGALLAGCNLPSAASTQDPNFIFTQAAQTVEAQLTMMAPLATATSPLPATTDEPTPEPALPTSTPPIVPGTPTQVCDKMQFVTDVTVVDGTKFSEGETFKKTWRVRNAGSCTWGSSYALVFSSGNAMGGPAVIPLAGNIAPGQTLDISVDLTAPNSPGDYTGYWKLRNGAGVLFGTVFVKINVPEPLFAVTSVNMSVSGTCGDFTIRADITASRAGNVTYKWRRSDGAVDTVNHPPVVFSSAGTQSVSTKWTVTAPGSHWMDIYIDKPNNQQFGRVILTCP